MKTARRKAKSLGQVAYEAHWGCLSKWDYCSFKKHYAKVARAVVRASKGRKKA